MYNLIFSNGCLTIACKIPENLIFPVSLSMWVLLSMLGPPIFSHFHCHWKPHLLYHLHADSPKSLSPNQNCPSLLISRPVFAIAP